MVVLIMTITMLPKDVQPKLKKNKSFMNYWVSCERLVYLTCTSRILGLLIQKDNSLLNKKYGLFHYLYF